MLGMNLFEITLDDVHRRQNALAVILEQMDVPENTRDTSSRRNLNWLNRNLAVQNSNHPLFQTANDLVVWLCRWHNHNANA